MVCGVLSIIGSRMQLIDVHGAFVFIRPNSPLSTLILLYGLLLVGLGALAAFRRNLKPVAVTVIACAAAAIGGSLLLIAAGAVGDDENVGFGVVQHVSFGPGAGLILVLTSSVVGLAAAIYLMVKTVQAGP